MVLNLLSPEVVKHMQSGSIDIVADNARSHKLSLSELMDPPVQLVPFGSSWMKISACPAIVKQKMKLQVPGTRLTKQQSRWRASGSNRNSFFPRKCQSDTNISLLHSSTPKMPFRRASITQGTNSVVNDMINASWDNVRSQSEKPSPCSCMQPSTRSCDVNVMSNSSSHSNDEFQIAAFFQESSRTKCEIDITTKPRKEKLWAFPGPGNMVASALTTNLYASSMTGQQTHCKLETDAKFRDGSFRDLVKAQTCDEGESQWGCCKVVEETHSKDPQKISLISLAAKSA